MSKAYTNIVPTKSVHLKRGEVLPMMKTEPTYAPNEFVRELAAIAATISFVIGGSLMIWVAFAP